MGICLVAISALQLTSTHSAHPPGPAYTATTKQDSHHQDSAKHDASTATKQSSDTQPVQPSRPRFPSSSRLRKMRILVEMRLCRNVHLWQRSQQFLMQRNLVLTRVLGTLTRYPVRMNQPTVHTNRHRGTITINQGFACSPLDASHSFCCCKKDKESASSVDHSTHQAPTA
jgi:hypothetical protein